MKMIRDIAFYCAGLVIVLHALIPHQHEEDMSFEEHQKLHSESHSFLDEIALALHESHHAGEMDFFILDSDAHNFEAPLAYYPVISNYVLQLVDDLYSVDLFKEEDNIQAFESDNSYTIRHVLPQLANIPPPTII